MLDRKWLLVYLFALSFHPIFLPLSDRPIVSMCRVVMKWNVGACMHGFMVLGCGVLHCDARTHFFIGSGLFDGVPDNQSGAM